VPALLASALVSECLCAHPGSQDTRLAEPRFQNAGFECTLFDGIDARISTGLEFPSKTPELAN